MPKIKKQPVSLEHFLAARVKYVGWIQALQADRELTGKEFETLLTHAYDLLAAHDHEGRRWYGKDYNPSPTEQEMKGVA